MLRRRRPPKNEAIHFSFDSFLDLVTNVVGIIIRLILVTWVGARSYHTSMQWVDTAAPAATGQTEPAEKLEPLPPPKITDEPLYSKLQIAQQEIQEAKIRLLAQLKDLETVEQKSQGAKAQLILLSDKRRSLEEERKKLAGTQSETSARIQLASMSVGEIRQRSKKLLEDLKLLETLPSPRKQLKYHAPVSREVHSDEIYFECKNGQVTFIDLPAFMIEVQQSLESIKVELRSRWKVERMSTPVGPYRLRYVVERNRTVLDTDAAPTGNYFGYGLSAWTVEPISERRGESLQAALQPRSEFRQIVDPLDGNITTVTFWVYPDSFEMFRQLRDHLYERGLDVAGRPLPPDSPIAASKHGTASRGQ